MVVEVCGVEWQPRNIQVDQSNIEKNGIFVAFPGMYAGEEEVKVHVARTLMRRLTTHKPTYATMLQAVNKTTMIGATALVREAINNAPKKLADYLESNWTNPAELDCWTMAARQHSPTLLQFTSPNPLESYHRLIKADRSCGRFSGIQKAGVGVCKVNIQRRLEAYRDEVLFKSKVLKDTEEYPNIGRFPLPIQRLLIDQYRAVEKRIEKGKPSPDYDTMDCNCLFILTDAVWDKFAQLFDECGFEVYESKVRVLVEREEVSQVDIYRDYRKRQVKEAEERFLNHDEAYQSLIGPKAGTLEHAFNDVLAPRAGTAEAQRSDPPNYTEASSSNPPPSLIPEAAPTTILSPPPATAQEVPASDLPATSTPNPTSTTIHL
ncbi:hypothetical protein DFS34DRAFT_649662 [Phlyctochytrium arcticum]|nr:hypothetical protein DFS34DRAFT_649662 [Phlyctochytrium arcticum]